MKSTKANRSIAGAHSIAAAADLGQQLETLRQKSAGLSTGVELETLLEEARLLLKATFQTEFETAARRLFRELRQRVEIFSTAPPADPPARAVQLHQRLQSERLRLAGQTSLADQELAVEGLHLILRELGEDQADASLRSQVLETLETAANGQGDLKNKIRELLEVNGLTDQPGLREFMERLSTPTTPTPHTPVASTLAPPRVDELTQQLAQTRRLYYAGDYDEAIDLLTEILRVVPDNKEAQERLAQVEDNIRRGLVPDSRVPFDARAAYGRAQSLERAGRFEEARVTYVVSLNEARQGGRHLQNWQPAIEALLRVDNSILARQIREEADALLQSDQWREALAKYAIVLKLLPEDELARQRQEQLQALLAHSEVLPELLTTGTSSLLETGQRLVALRQSLQAIRPQLPDSQRLKDLTDQLAVALPTRAAKLLERSQQLLTQARYLPNIAGSRRLTAEATKLLQMVRVLAPEDSQALDLAETAQAELERLSQVESDLNEARRLVNLNTGSSRRPARDLLRQLQEYIQEPLYLQLVATLQSQYIEEAQQALRHGQLAQVAALLADMTQDIFSPLGLSDDVWRLQQALEAAQRRPWIRVLSWSAGIVLIGLLLLGASQWGGGLSLAFAPTTTPLPQPLPTNTPVITATVQPTQTLTLTLTATSSATPTATLTATSTEQVTSTPAPRFGAVKFDSTARLTPDGTAAWAFSIHATDPVQVLEETQDTQGRLWYKILYARGDSVLIGWARAIDINVMIVTAVP